MDYPDAAYSPTYVSTLSVNAAVQATGGTIGSITTGLGWTANRAIYIPFALLAPFTLRRFIWWPNTAACNIDMGIYTSDGARLISTGSTASSRSSVTEYITPAAPYLLTPGRYYLAFACDTTAATGLFNTGPSAVLIGNLEMVGVLTQDTAFPLPAQATFAKVATNIYPFYGITQT